MIFILKWNMHDLPNSKFSALSMHSSILIGTQMTLNQFWVQIKASTTLESKNSKANNCMSRCTKSQLWSNSIDKTYRAIKDRILYFNQYSAIIQRSRLRISSLSSSSYRSSSYLISLYTFLFAWKKVFHQALMSCYY